MFLNRFNRKNCLNTLAISLLLFAQTNAFAQDETYTEEEAYAEESYTAQEDAYTEDAFAEETYTEEEDAHTEEAYAEEAEQETDGNIEELAVGLKCEWDNSPVQIESDDKKSTVIGGSVSCTDAGAEVKGKAFCCEQPKIPSTASVTSGLCSSFPPDATGCAEDSSVDTARYDGVPDIATTGACYAEFYSLADICYEGLTSAKECEEHVKKQGIKTILKGTRFEEGKSCPKKKEDDELAVDEWGQATFDVYEEYADDTEDFLADDELAY